MPRWPWRIFQITTLIEGLGWIAGGVFCLLLAAAVWSRRIPDGEDALLIATAYYRNVGVSLFAAFGLSLVGVGALEAVKAVREEP